MKKRLLLGYFILASFFLLGFVTQKSLAATGNLTISIMSADFYFDKAAGDTVKYYLIYNWTGDGPAPNVQVINTIPSEINYISATQVPSSISGNDYTWNFGTVNNYHYGTIEVTGIIKSNVQKGSKITLKASITGDVTDTDPADNTMQSEISISGPEPDLWVITWGLLEESESDFAFYSEQDVPINFNIIYINLSNHVAENVTLVDTLPSGTEFISADVQPSSINGNILTWNLNTLTTFGSGQIKAKVRPTRVGSFTNNIYISSSSGDKKPEDNRYQYSYQVVSLLQPRLLKPAISYFGSSDTLIMSSNPTMSGLAKAGAKVTLYEGNAEGGFGLESVNPVELGSAIAGPDRRWSIKPVNMNQGRKYYLYVRAEKDGEKSSPFFDYWLPFAIKVEPLLELTGFDPDNFVVSSDGHDVYPGALGTRSGTTPNSDIIIKKTQKAPASFLTDKNLWLHHTMKVVVTESGVTDTFDLPVSDVKVLSTSKTNPSNPSNAEEYVTYELIYVQKGFGPGAVIEVWCRPTYYDDNGNVVLAGLVFVKCHEILIDPAGYVYEAVPGGAKYEWPEVPPDNLLIKNATVTAMVRTGDDNWTEWDAASTGQVNPQVTDSTTNDRIFIPGYFAFYVPSGQYQVKATAEGFAEYVSPILTVVDEPVFHNCGMTRLSSALTGVKFDYKPTSVPAIYTLDQNYPNPFNPVTTMSYYIPVMSKVTLKVYDIRGREIATLINNEERLAGKHVLQFDGSRLSSGVYFYTLTANSFMATKKFVLLK